MDPSNSPFIGVLGLSGICFPPKLALPVRGFYSHVTPIPQAKPIHHPKRHFDRFSHFCVGLKCYAIQCILSGEENPQNCPFALGYFVNLPEEDRATAIGNTQKNCEGLLWLVGAVVCLLATPWTAWVQLSNVH